MNLKKLGVTMAFPNTHAFAFTQLPKSLTKTWERQGFRGGSPIACVTQPHRHRHSIVSKISLRIEFDRIANFSDTDFDAAEDGVDDAVDLWKENKGLWREIEAAVERVIAEYGKRTQALVEQQGASGPLTYDVPCKGTTKVERHLDRPDELSRGVYKPDADLERTVVTLDDTRTIMPSDSASMIQHPEIQDYIRDTVNDVVHEVVKRYNLIPRRGSHSTTGDGSSSSRSAREEDRSVSKRGKRRN